MNEKFFDLKKEKQERMINASLKIFARNGYQYASTDEIVKEAGISKGLLFHYFGSKLGLYTFLADYCVRYMKMEISNLSGKETDYFAILKDIEAAKLSALKNFPYLQQYLSTMEKETDSEAFKATSKQRSSLATIYQDIMKKADYANFCADADSKRVVKMMDMMLKSLMIEEMKSNAFKPEHYYAEAVKYIDMMGKLVKK
ncbi:MAG: TetR/AcrR family transcriptional regulator [Lachnospiraceae bacterium]|nr:TetR/AcrR family transcriptional regulator [Lachnospiraceae bacterium]